jgi:hypothetical protein
MPSLPANPLPVEPPADWRERLLNTLASDGISEPPYVPVWRLVLVNYLKVCAWILLALFLLYGIPAAAGQLMTEAASAWVLPIWLIGVAIVLFWFVWPHAQNAVRQFKMELAGRNPSHAVMKAHRPPIFYLRSFAFDQTASAAPKWLQRLLTVGSGAAAASTPEMNLVRQLRRYAPVLAIGRPGEVHPPPGAMRFYVTDARWEATVKSIVPCCDLVVWVSGNTRGLGWEIEQLIKSLPPQRLLLWPHVHINKLKRQQRDAEWLRFVDSHCDVFPKPLPRDVGTTRFIAFDADWTPLAIPNARYPAVLMDRMDLSRDTLGLRSFLKERFRE